MWTLRTRPSHTPPTRSAKLSLGACLVAATFATTADVQAAAPTYFSDRATFEALMQQLVTDDYSDGSYVFNQNNATMSAVLGETDYQSTGHNNINYVFDAQTRYCAGCNGSFLLSFTTTSIGTAAGVAGAGLDITHHNLNEPYFAFITFGDDSTDNVALPALGTFWGVTAPERIKSIHFGLTNEATTRSGSFAIDNLTIGREAVCGDGLKEGSEVCDDDNNTDGDGCSADCMSDETCGNGTLDTAAGEVCDDDNITGGDGCSADCMSDETCGNGTLDTAAGEACDDSNTTDGDGCSASCKLPDCGDGVIDSGETCDDNNNTDGDGCSANCASDETCGNGILDSAAGETCDDGNTTDGDGCAATCVQPNSPDCGNGMLDTGEACDEGADNGGALCASDCTLVADANAGADSPDGETVGGCGCTVVGEQSTPQGMALGLLTMGLLLAGRRRRRVGPWR